MRHSLWLVLIGILLLSGFTGCDRRSVDVPSKPQQVSSNDAKRVLAFQHYTTLLGKQYYNIFLYNTEDYNKDTDDGDVVEVVIADSVITMHYFDIPCWGGKGWYAEDSHYLAASQTVKLRINDKTVLTTTVKAVNRASAAFPASYDYQRPLTLNWYVASGNQYQFVKAEAWFSNMNCLLSPYSAYVKQVGAYERTHNFPAGCVTVTGDPEETALVLAVQQVNYKIADKTAVMVYQIESYGYQGVRAAEPKREMMRSAGQIHNLLWGQILSR